MAQFWGGARQSHGKPAAEPCWTIWRSPVRACNNHKHSKTDAPDPLSGALAPLFHPRRQRWRDHFAWDSTCTIVIGLTATGLATVAALQRDCAGLGNLRRVLYATGEHPPTDTGLG